MRSLTSALVFCSLLALPACDGGSKPDPVAEKAKAEAEAKKKQEQIEADAAIAAGKARREAEAKAKAEAEAKLKEAFDKLCVVPEKFTKDPVKGCEEVGQAHDAYMRRVDSPEELKAWDGAQKDKVIPMTVVQCSQADSAKVAACQKNALEGAGPELKGKLKVLLSTCITKFAGKKRPAAAGGLPPRRAG